MVAGGRPEDELEHGVLAFDQSNFFHLREDRAWIAFPEESVLVARYRAWLMRVLWVDQAVLGPSRGTFAIRRIASMPVVVHDDAGARAIQCLRSFGDRSPWCSVSVEAVAEHLRVGLCRQHMTEVKSKSRPWRAAELIC